MRTEYPAQKYDAASLRSRGLARARALPGRLVVQPEKLRGARILEIGCGFGEHTAALSDIYGANAIGIDPWNRASAGPFAGQFNYQPLDITTDAVLDLGLFDFIASYDTMEHVESPQPAIRNILRLLKPGGKAFLKYNLYRGASASHLVHITKFPWIQLIHTSEEIREPMREKYGLDRGSAWVNKLTYAHYLLYFRSFGGIVEREWYVTDKMSDEFYNKYFDRLRAYPRDELDRNFMCVVIQRPDR